MTILITGASSGIGESTAELLAKRGHKLILLARRLDRLNNLKKRLNTEVFIQSLDVRNKSAVESFFQNIPNEFKNIDVLINNAGVAIGMDLAYEAELTDWETMVDTNNKGLMYFTHFALKGMVKQNSGLIINMGSVAGNTAYERGNLYCATKAFVKHFTKALRSDLIGTNVKVSNIEPGAVETDISLIRFKGDVEKAKSVYANTRVLLPEDIANIIDWIISMPTRVNIDNIEVMPIDQANGGFNINRKIE